jgi:hypothetical protein
MFEILLLANYEYLFENIRRTSAAVTCIQLKGKLKKLGSKLETPVGYVLDTIIQPFRVCSTVVKVLAQGSFQP